MTRNTLVISALHQFWHGRNIFRPCICHCYPVARSPPPPLPIIKIYVNLFASPTIHLYGRNIFRPDVGHWWRVTAGPFLPRIICGTGEKYFAPTFAIVTLLPDYHHGRCQSSICSQTFSHTQSSIVGAKNISPGRRSLVARNRLTISAAHHLLHGRKIFRPYVRHRWRVTACLFLPRIICGTGEIFFAPTFAIGGA